MINAPRILELLHQVPRPPEDSIPGGISTRECDECEVRTGLRLPPDVREWLALANGPCVGPGGLYGILPARESLGFEEVINLFPSWRRNRWLPVAGDGCGDHYVIPTQQEYGVGYPVVFVDVHSSEDVPAYIVASDIGHFLNALLEEELGKRGWPFNEQYVCRTDPDIQRFTGVPLPWRAG